MNRQHSDVTIFLASGALVAAVVMVLAVAVNPIVRAHEPGQTCGGVERWDVKTLTDHVPLCTEAQVDPAKAKCIDVWTVTPTSIAQLAGVQVPTVKGDEPRGVSSLEYGVASIEGWFHVEKVEADQDAHLAVQDQPSGGHSMVTESADPDCAKGSVALDDLVLVRLALMKAIGGPVTGQSVKKLHGRHVRVTGVVFFDKESKAHDPSGSAPNGAELHPILRVDFLDQAGASHQ